MKKSAFNFRFEWRDALSGCPSEVRLEVYEAIIEYAASGTLVDLKPVAKMAFSFIQKTMDDDKIKAEELRRKRSEGGKKGMRNRYNSLSENLTQPNSLSENLTQPNSEIPPKEIPPIPPKENTPKDSEVNNNILLTRTREEIELQRFDALLQEVVDGKHQVWEDEMRKKHRIDNVTDYLPSFRSHVIANAKMASVTDVNGFKQYFNVAFRFFSKSTPIELLGQYEHTAQTEPFRKFCQWVLSSAPNVAREIIPLTEDEFTRLRETYGSEKIALAVLAIGNRKDLVAKYYSLYHTLAQWLEKDFNN